MKPICSRLLLCLSHVWVILTPSLGQQPEHFWQIENLLLVADAAAMFSIPCTGGNVTAFPAGSCPSGTALPAFWAQAQSHDAHAALQPVSPGKKQHPGPQQRALPAGRGDPGHALLVVMVCCFRMPIAVVSGQGDEGLH